VKQTPDLVAGLTLAAHLLPAGIGDASLAGRPPETGLALLAGTTALTILAERDHAAA
jgi:MFS superfamily sulfate permease-like transporter